MKYNALIVPVLALVAVANALPQDASAQAQHDKHPSDQGDYQPASTSPDSPSNVKTTLEDVSQAGLGKLPVKAPANVPFEMIPSTPLDGVDTSSVPINGKTLPGTLPVNEQTVEGVKDGLPIKLPIDVPPKAPGMRRSRQHVVRDGIEKKDCGNLRVEASDNKYSGFVSRRRDANGRHTVVKNAGDATVVDLQGHDLIFRGQDFYPALGGTFGVVRDGNAPEDDLGGNSANFVMLTGTSTTRYGKAASTGRSSFNEATRARQRVESAIYSFGENGEIRTTWVNRDGNSVPATFGVNTQGQIILSGNPGQYAAKYGGYSARLFCQQ